MEGQYGIMRSMIGDMVAREAQVMQLPLSTCEIQSFDVFAAELKKWNSKLNLTTITNESEIAIKHFADSLSLAPYIAATDRLLDIGSGAGFPVIPIKIIRPEISMVSVDAVEKKVFFQRHIIRILNLQNIEAIHARVEELHSTHRHSFSVITSRAFTRLDRFVSLAAPLLKEDGVLIAMKGICAEDKYYKSAMNVNADIFTVTSEHHYSLSHNMGERVLLFIKKSKAL